MIMAYTVLAIIGLVVGLVLYTIGLLLNKKEERQNWFLF